MSSQLETIQVVIPKVLDGGRGRGECGMGLKCHTNRLNFRREEG